jgi:predicted SAM-dependent methyltransferase
VNILNLGCGSDILYDAWNVDRAPLPGVNEVVDLDTSPWPWSDASYSVVRAKDVFEHVADPILFMTQCHRVLASSGLLWIRTPHWSSVDAFTDPTHRRFPTEHTFDYWIRDTLLYRLHNAAYGGVSFTSAGLRADNGSMIVELIKS